ncbi:MAG: CvpA family protein [Saprospiraceae bacterium]|nr:CvpA family protein [Saprospiraceae bacterium]
MIIDILCGLIVGFCFYLGYTKGIIKTVFGVLSIIIGLLATLKFSHLTMNLLDKVFDVDPRIMIIIGFVLTFLLILIGIRMIGNAVEKLLETAHINFINQIAGGVVSALIALVIYSSIVGFVIRLRLLKRMSRRVRSLIQYLLRYQKNQKIFSKRQSHSFQNFGSELKKQSTKSINPCLKRNWHQKKPNNETLFYQWIGCGSPRFQVYSTTFKI